MFWIFLYTSPAIKMSSILCYVLLVAPVVLATVGGQTGQVPLSPYSNIDSQVLLNVFGTPLPSYQADSAVRVEQTGGTLVDPDYWDAVDDFKPSAVDYDNFDWLLTKRVAGAAKENTLLSPLGLKLALAILNEAATGATASELQFVLGFDNNRKNIRKKFETILESLQTRSTQYILDLGSRIYVGNNAEPRQMFAAIAEQFYKTEVKKADFGHPATAVRDINQWISNITHGRINDLVTEDDAAGIVMMVLNTLYFKGTWRHQFAPNDTKSNNFFVSPTLAKKVPFMTVKNKFYYTESTKLDAKILRLPYLGKKFSMYIVVPNAISGLTRALSGLTELRNEIFYLQQQQVQVTLPRFQFEFTSHLNGVLKEMGIRQAFEDTASFPGIARGQLLQQRLKVSKVLQRSGIEVNELGSIAYSATEISLVNKFGSNDDIVYEVLANKPFLFFIEDEATRQLLFTGILADPIA